MFICLQHHMHAGPSAPESDGIVAEAGTAEGAVGPAAAGTPLAAAPRGPADMFPGTAPAPIVPIVEPVLTPVDAPTPMAPIIAPEVGPQIAPEIAPLPMPELAPLEAIAPIAGPGVAPLEVPELAPGLAPELSPELAPVPGPEEMPELAPEEVPGPAPLAIDPDVEQPMAVEPVLAPVPAPVGTFQDRVVPGPDGKYPVCVNGDSEEWGDWKKFRPCGVRVFADGRVELGEWYGGFDGFPAVDPADGHETCFNTAVAEMFGLPICSYSKTTDGVDDDGNEVEAIECEENEDGTQCACAADDKIPSLKSQRNWPGNVGVITFLTTMRERADPVNYDFPQDEEVADAGGRADNVKAVQAVFEDMITVSQC